MYGVVKVAVRQMSALLSAGTFWHCAVVESTGSGGCGREDPSELWPSEMFLTADRCHFQSYQKCSLLLTGITSSSTRNRPFPHNSLLTIPQLNTTVRLQNSEVRNSPNHECFLQQTGPILGHTASIKLLKHLQYAGNKIVINSQEQTAILTSVSICNSYAIS